MITRELFWKQRCDLKSLSGCKENVTLAFSFLDGTKMALTGFEFSGGKGQQIINRNRVMVPKKVSRLFILRNILDLCIAQNERFSLHSYPVASLQHLSCWLLWATLPTCSVVAWRFANTGQFFLVWQAHRTARFTSIGLNFLLKQV